MKPTSPPSPGNGAPPEVRSEELSAQEHRVAACAHVTAETANLLRTLDAAGASVGESWSDGA